MPTRSVSLDPNGKVVGTGFAFVNGEWKFKSCALSAPAGSEWRGVAKSASEGEVKIIRRAIDAWILSGCRQQNFSVASLNQGESSSQQQKCFRFQSRAIWMSGAKKPFFGSQSLCFLQECA